MHPPEFPLLHAASARSISAVLIVAMAMLSGCAQVRPKPAAVAAETADNAPERLSASDGVAPRVRADAPVELPKQDLTDQILYEFLLAEVAAQRGNANVAAQAYADLARRTRDPRIARRATDVAVFARMPEAAIASAKIWLETEPGSPEAMRTLTSLLVTVNRLDEAQPYLQKILAAEENRGDGFLQLNRLLANNPDKAGTLRVIQKLAEPYPNLPQAHFAIAQAAAAAAEDELALKEARLAAKLRPDWELATLFEAQLLQKTSNAAASALLADYLKRYPKARDVRLNYARTLVSDKKYPEARVQFEQLIKDFPDNTDVIFAVAVLSMQLEDWSVAEANLKRLLELNYRDRNTVRLYLGQIAEEQKRYPEALQSYRDVGRGEQFLTAQIRQATVLAKQGDLDGARSFLQQVGAANNQQRVQLILAEAQLLRDANQSKEAFIVVEKGLDKLPEHPELLYDYAMLAEKLDRMDIMESSLRKLIRINPDHAHAYNALGYSLADRNERLSEARELIEKAHKLAPDDAFITDSMGWVAYRQGQYEEALKYLRQAYAERPDAEIAAHLGEVLWTVGRRDEARKIWDEAIGKTPANDSLIKTIQRFKQ